MPESKWQHGDRGVPTSRPPGPRLWSVRCEFHSACSTRWWASTLGVATFCKDAAFVHANRENFESAWSCSSMIKQQGTGGQRPSLDSGHLVTCEANAALEAATTCMQFAIPDVKGGKHLHTPECIGEPQTRRDSTGEVQCVVVGASRKPAKVPAFHRACNQQPHVRRFCLLAKSTIRFVAGHCGPTRWFSFLRLFCVCSPRTQG